MGTQEIFDKINQAPLLLAYFSQPACSVCTVLRPKIKDLATQYDIPFQYVNTLDYPMVSGQHMVFAVPTIILFQNGRELERWSRTVGVEQVENILKRMRSTL